MISTIDGYYFGLYFLLCVLSIYSGMGVLLLLKLNIDTKKLLLLSPFMAQVLIALLLNIGVHWLFLAEVIKLNSAEHINGFSNFWIGNEAIKIILFASRAGQVEVTGDFSPGPSFPDSTQWKLSVRTDSGYMDEITITEHSRVQILARQGRNEIMIQALDKPTLLTLPNADKRAMLIGVSNLRLIYPSMDP